uniref:Retrovirus-related Env polyprotein from transposon gypsy n=2 Tax=Ceratitis capitata TaxID=7213 RepID=W8ARF0_CERCA
MSYADIQIHDYSSSHLITIDNGYSKIKDGTLNFIHIIDIQAYRNVLENITDMIEKSYPPENPIYPTLQHEAQQALEMLEIVEPIQNPRIRRSFDILGTAWKYLAGSPDHDDLNMINNNLDKLITNNNNQIFINNAVKNQINKLTEITNNILQSIKNDNMIANEIALNLQNRLRLIKEEIINIKYAIQWARLGIVNTIILNKKEIETFVKEFNKENMPFNTVEEALELADINVLSNSTTILYILKIPLTTREVYNNYIIKSVIRNDVMINLKFNNVLKNKNTIYGIKNQCKKYNKVSICKQEELLDLSNDFCISKLIKSQNSSCHMVNSHHIPRHELITPGIIFLNDYHGNIVMNDNIRIMNGTYIINFRNASITINERTYKNFESPVMKVMPAIAQPTPIEESITKLLSLEALSELNVNNTVEIHSLQIERTVNRISSGITLLMVIILMASAINYFHKKTKSTKPTESSSEDNQLQEITTEAPIPETRTFQIFQTLEDKRF